MKLSDIHTLIKAGESKTLEFKTSTAKLKSAFETLCALLNTEGGSVLIGVKDNGEVVGQAVTDKTRLEIANMAAKFEPAIRITEAYIPVGDHYVIQLTATPHPEMIPYVFDGKPFWRIGSSTRRMPQQAYQQMLMDRADALQFWNAETTTPLAIEDLDQAQILYTLDESIKRGRTKAALATKDPKIALQTLGLLKNGLITHAGGMLFCKDAETHFPQSLLRLVLFKGLTKSEILDSRRIYDNAFALLAETEAFLMRHMSIASEFIPGKMARKDHPEYSLRAVREAMVNAICHRDYRIKGGSISLMMYDNRLEITSHGTLPRGITVDDLNPNLAPNAYCRAVRLINTTLCSRHKLDVGWLHLRLFLIASLVFISLTALRYGLGARFGLNKCMNPSPETQRSPT